MVTLHGEEVKVGDRVWHLFRGWGEVVEIDEDTYYPILAHWDGRGEFEWYTEDGKFHTVDKTPVLYWQPIEFEIPKKPKPKKKEKVWQWICKTGDEYWMTEHHYPSGDSALSKFPNTEIIEPYLPSEIEREVKE